MFVSLDQLIRQLRVITLLTGIRLYSTPARGGNVRFRSGFPLSSLHGPLQRSHNPWRPALAAAMASRCSARTYYSYHSKHLSSESACIGRTHCETQAGHQSQWFERLAGAEAQNLSCRPPATKCPIDSYAHRASLASGVGHRSRAMAVRARSQRLAGSSEPFKAAGKLDPSARGKARGNAGGKEKTPES